MLETTERVGDREHAHGELARKGAARQRRAGPELPAKDAIPDRVVRLLRQAATTACISHGGRVAKRSDVVNNPGRRSDDSAELWYCAGS
jgi:hypothetical protein